MPKTFIIFTISGLALMGVPGMAGFVSKWNLASAAIDNGSTLALVGIGCLLVSALLTAIYMMSITVRAFWPHVGFDDSVNEGITDPNWKMMLPLIIFVVMMVVLGLHSEPLMQMLMNVAGM